MSMTASLEAEGSGKTPPPKKHILVVWARIPTPDVDAGSLRVCNLLELLKGMSYSVTLVASFPSSWPPYAKRLGQDTEHMRAIGVEIPPEESTTSVEDHLRQCGGRYHIVVLGGEYVAAKHSASVRKYAPKAVVVFDTGDIHYLRFYREAKATGNKRALKRAIEAKVRETAAIEEADHTIVVSLDEKALVERDCPGTSVHVLPIVQDPHGCARPFSERQHILFLGSFQHAPNLDAVTYLMEEIYPSIRTAIPGLKCYLIGANPPDFVKQFQSSEVIVTGHVPDLSLYFDVCRLCVAPLRFGAGVKGKVLSSMSYGVPVVGSSVAAEGLHVVDRRHMLIANNPTAFSNAVAAVYNDEDTWNRLSTSGFDILSEHFSSRAIQDKLERLLANAGKG